jgi:hypothetical protein
MPQTRRHFLRNSAALAVALPLARAAEKSSAPAAAGDLVQEKPHVSPDPMPHNVPHMVEADGRLRFDFGEQRLVLDGGLQPFLLATREGTLILQVQSPHPPFNTPRMHYPYAMWTALSRDGGKTWIRQPLKPGDNGLNTEGGTIQLRDGTILGLDTYVTPGAREGVGLGHLYTSRDDWRTLSGPEEITFELPNVNFRASKDDGGHPHEAQRLHRRIVELPNGDLLTTLYGQFHGDHTPATYQPLMMKARVMLLRSTNRGRHWKLVSTVAVDPAVGTEGFNEPALVRIRRGAHAGRLLCFMRTGRELREAFSDDEGVTWSVSRPRVFAGLDVHRTELWVDMFRHLKGRSGKLLDENNPDDLKGAAVDPDLIELRSGLLVTTFGLRIPQKACWPHAQHPWNGNYLAVSRDGGETWPNVVRLTSGVLTTHYTAVEETSADNELFVVYDYGFWRQPSRFTYGRTVKITEKPA